MYITIPTIKESHQNLWATEDKAPESQPKDTIPYNQARNGPRSRE